MQTEDEEKDEQIKRECEKIFHPEKFKFHELTTSLPTTETPNIDWGALFYAQQQKVSEPSLITAAEEEKRVTFEDATKSDTFNRYRKYGRSFSQQDTSSAGTVNF